MADNLYGVDSIESLDAREHVRLRPGMYAGNTANPNHLLVEIFSNALDEYNIGHGNLIQVYIHNLTGTYPGRCEVQDWGQGFPINEMREDGKTVLEAAFSVINTSGKFREDGVYEGSSLGLNGIGGKLTNFLSKEFEVLSWQKGKYEHLWFKDGIFQRREIGDWEDSKDPSGTQITYTPDPQFFDSAETDIKFFQEFFNDIACLCPDLTIELNGESIHHNSIEDLINRKIGDDIEIINDRLVIKHKESAGQLDLALSFCGKSSPTIISYVNYGLTTVGPHITAMKSTITRVLNNWAKENGLLKAKDKNLDGASLQEGMILVSNIVSKNVAYDAQVKTTITKIDSSFATSTLGKELEIWLDSNPENAKNIINKALVARKAAEAAKKAREAVKAKAVSPKVAKKKNLDLPSKLADCYSKNRQKCELYIVEGDSAGGNLKDMRDNEFQAILPVRGKVLNVETATVAAIEKNAEIQDMINAFGLTKVPGKKEARFNKDNIRYGKIILMSDADVDGSHIKNLLYTFIWKYAPELIEEGYVYAGVPPLYRLKNNKETIYIKDDNELENWKKKNDISKFQVSRLKGLGEMSPEETEECLLDTKTRIIKQITVEDIGATNLLIQKLMGKDTVNKKKFIEEHEGDAEIYV